jgi:hypothetical protein
MIFEGLFVYGPSNIRLIHGTDRINPHQRVSGHERIRAGVKWTGAKRLHRLVELLGHLRHFRLRRACHTEGLDKALQHRSVLARRQQPVREIAARAQLGDRHVDRADTSVEIAMRISVVRRITR